MTKKREFLEHGESRLPTESSSSEQDPVQRGPSRSIGTGEYKLLEGGKQTKTGGVTAKPFAAILHSAKVQLYQTTIWSGGAITDVVGFGRFKLVILVSLDPGLLGNGYRFVSNFNIIQASNNNVINYFWNGNLDKDLIATDFWMSVEWQHPSSDGLIGGGADYRSGLYLFKPYFVVDANKYGGDLYQATGKSEFAVAEDHWFWVE